MSTSEKNRENIGPALSLAILMLESAGFLHVEDDKKPVMLSEKFGVGTSREDLKEYMKTSMGDLCLALTLFMERGFLKIPKNKRLLLDLVNFNVTLEDIEIQPGEGSFFSPTIGRA
jgi:hypothetical protein